MRQHEIEIVVGAEGMAPRQPIEDDGPLLVQERPQLCQGLLVGTQHAMRVDDAFGRAGRSRGEQDLGDRVGADLSAPLGIFGGRSSFEQVGKVRQLVTCRLCAAGDDLDTIQQSRASQRVQRRAIAGAIRDIEETRRQRGHDRLQLGMITALQRIGDRDRRCGNTNGHGAENEQRVVDAVFREDADGPLCSSAPSDERLTDRGGGLQSLRITQPPPAAVRASFR